MFVDGLKLFVVLLAYTLVPYVVLLAGGFLGSGEGGGIGSLLGLLVLLAGVVLVVLGAYLVPVALTNFALEGQLGAAFDIETVFHAAITGRYFVAVVLAVVGGVLSFLASLLSVLIVGIFLSF